KYGAAAEKSKPGMTPSPVREMYQAKQNMLESQMYDSTSDDTDLDDSPTSSNVKTPSTYMSSLDKASQLTSKSPDLSPLSTRGQAHTAKEQSPKQSFKIKPAPRRKLPVPTSTA